MAFMDLLRPRQVSASPEDRERELTKLTAKSKNLRGRISRNQGELKRLWTEFRTTTEGQDVKKPLRAKIKRVEAERKALVKEMVKLQSEIARIGGE